MAHENKLVFSIRFMLHDCHNFKKKLDMAALTLTDEQNRFYHTEMPSKDTEGNADSENPDQTV